MDINPNRRGAIVWHPRWQSYPTQNLRQGNYVENTGLCFQQTYGEMARWKPLGRGFLLRSPGTGGGGSFPPVNLMTLETLVLSRWPWAGWCRHAHARSRTLGQLARELDHYAGSFYFGGTMLAPRAQISANKISAESPGHSSFCRETQNSRSKAEQNKCRAKFNETLQRA